MTETEPKVILYEPSFICSSNLKSTRANLQQIRDKWKCDDSFLAWQKIRDDEDRNITIEQFATAYLIEKYQKRYQKNSIKLKKIGSTNKRKTAFIKDI